MERPGSRNPGDRDGHRNEAAAGRRRHGKNDGTFMRRGLETGRIRGGAAAGHQDGRLFGCRGRGRGRPDHSVAAGGPSGRHRDEPDDARNRRQAVHLSQEHGGGGALDAQGSPGRRDLAMAQAQGGPRSEEAARSDGKRHCRDRKEAGNGRRRDKRLIGAGPAIRTGGQGARDRDRARGVDARFRR